MDQRPTYLDLGFGKDLQRGDAFATGGVSLAEGQLLSGGSVNGTTNLVEDQTQTADIASGEISEHIDIAADGHIKGGATDYLAGDGFWLGSYNGDSNDYRFFIGDSVGQYLSYANGVLTISGSFTATSGTIGGFDIGTDYVRDVANTFGLSSTITGGDDVRIWAGASFANRATAPFRVTEAGVMTATSAVITIATLGGFDIGSDYIRDAANTFGLASTVSGSNDVRFWAGAAFASRATAPWRLFEDGTMFFGTTTGGSVAFDPAGFTVVSTPQLSLTARFTAGFDITQGETVAIESDGLTYPPRYTANVTDSSASVSAASTSASRGGSAFVGHTETVSSSTCTMLSVVLFGGNAVLYSTVVTNDPIALATIPAGGVTINAATKAGICPVLTTTALSCYLNGTTVSGRVISNLQQSTDPPTLNGATTISTSADYPAVARYSDTVVAAIYIDTGTGDIKGRVLTVGATTFTTGSAQTILATVGAKIWNINRFGTSDFYLLAFEDTSSNQKVMVVQFDGATFTGGTPVTELATTGGRYLGIDCLDSTKGVVVRNISSSIQATIYTRSGTGLTAGSPVSLRADAKADAGASLGVRALGADTFVFAYIGSAANVARMSLARVTGTVPSNIGVVMNEGSVANPGTLTTILHCYKVNPKYYGVMYQDTSGSALIQFRVYLPTNTYPQVIGLVAADTATSAVGGIVMQGYSDDVTGLTTASPYYVDLDGALIVRTEGGLQRFGIALSATTIKVE